MNILSDFELVFIFDDAGDALDLIAAAVDRSSGIFLCL
jgi:hypothetical protein